MSGPRSSRGHLGVRTARRASWPEFGRRRAVQGLLCIAANSGSHLSGLMLSIQSSNLLGQCGTTPGPCSRWMILCLHLSARARNAAAVLTIPAIKRT